jgi:hypothetical protein
VKRTNLITYLACCAVVATGCTSAAPEPLSREGSELKTLAPRLDPYAACMDAALSAATQALPRTGEVGARQILEIEAKKCAFPDISDNDAKWLAVVNTDFAHLGSQYAAGKLSMVAYHAAVQDRARKLTRIESDPNIQLAISSGDADRDLVPDSVDRCPQTPYGSPTDDAGCPTGTGGLEPGPDDVSTQRELSQVKFLHNTACDGQPTPSASVALQWGRSKVKTPGGYNLAFTRSHGSVAACEVFYEIQIRYTDPAAKNLPPVDYVNVLFSEREDLLGDPTQVVFGLPPPPQALSPGRTAAHVDFGQYQTAHIRVRAVDGSQHGSEWSPSVALGPASGGLL